MKTFRSIEDVLAADLPLRHRKLLLRFVMNLADAYGTDFDPELVEGAIMLDQTTTDEQALELFGQPWHEVPYEEVMFDEPSRCFLTCVLFDEGEGVTIMVPDEPWLDPVLRARFERGMTLASCHAKRKGTVTAMDNGMNRTTSLRPAFARQIIREDAPAYQDFKNGIACCDRNVPVEQSM